MPRRTNKATIQDTTLGDAFRQGFAEGLQQSEAETMYEFTATFEGTDLRRVQFSDLDQALREARELLLHGPGTKITIVAVTISTPQASAPEAVAEADDIEDAVVVEDTPSGE